MEELRKLKEEANALKLLKQSAGQKDYAQNVFKKVFTTDIERLLTMKEMWKEKTPPKVLTFEQLESLEKAAVLSDTERDQSVWTVKANFEIFLDR